MAAVGSGACAILGAILLVLGRSEPWRIAIAVPAFALVLSVCLYGFGSRPYFRRCIGLCSARELGMYRAAICTIVLLQTLSEPLASLSTVPPEILRPMGVMRALRPFLDTAFARSSVFLASFQVVTCALLACAALGYRTRLTLPLAGVLSVVCGGLVRERTHFFHTGLLSLQLLLLLAFLPCADGFALDVRRKPSSSTDRKVRLVVYGFSRYALWLWVSTVYFCTGISKVRAFRGVGWASPDNLRRFLFRDFLQIDYLHFDAANFIFQAPDTFFYGVGVATLFVELLYPAVLLSKHARRIFPVLALTMHAGILFFQGFTFFDCVLLNVAFFALGMLGRFQLRKVPTNAPYRMPRFGEPSASHRFCLSPGTARVFALLCLLAPIQLFVWFGRIEQYPLTQWALYSVPGVVGRSDFVRVEGTDLTGKQLGNVLAQCNAIYRRDSRWRDIVKRVTSHPDTYEKWLRVCARELARARPAAEPQREVCIARYSWDFERFPGDPRQAVLDQRDCTTLEPPSQKPNAHP